MNPRPHAPKARALPDCATPRRSRVSCMSCRRLLKYTPIWAVCQPPPMNFFADFLILFGRFSGNPRKCPFFRHFFASPCRSSGAFSAHILLQSLLRDHAEAQKGGSSRNLGGRVAWGRVCGRAKLGAGTLRCLRLCWRLPWDWLDAEQLGRCPKPHKGRCPLTLQGADEKGRSPPP